MNINFLTLKDTAMKLLLNMIGTALLAAMGFSQTPSADKITVPLTDPARPVFLKVGLISGGITVKGYNGNEVVVEENIRKSDDDDEDKEDSEENEHRADHKGLHLIPNTSSGLTVEEEDNRVSINTSGMMASRTVDLIIQVPHKTSMKLNTINDGDIHVSDVAGDLEISDINGKIECSQISGSLMADALNGGVTATFTGVDPEKPMSFSSLNGDLDVTFPSTLKSTVRLKNEQGQIFSDFDIKMNASTTKMEDNAAGKHGRYKVSVEKMMSGTINGGGTEIVFKNFNGDIVIRKGK